MPQYKKSTSNAQEMSERKLTSVGVQPLTKEEYHVSASDSVN
jgi:hypothetical protein